MLGTDAAPCSELTLHRAWELTLEGARTDAGACQGTHAVNAATGRDAAAARAAQPFRAAPATRCKPAASALRATACHADPTPLFELRRGRAVALRAKAEAKAGRPALPEAAEALARRKACARRPGGEFQPAPEYSIEMLDVIDKPVPDRAMADELASWRKAIGERTGAATFLVSSS